MKRGGRKSFSHAEGGAQKVLGSFLRGSLNFSHIVGGGGGTKSFHHLKEGKKFYPVLRGGLQKVSDPRFSHFVAPPPSP